MNRPQRGILALFITVLAVMFLFPPYFGMDQTSEGRIHGSLGYHPAWKAPSQERAHAILLEEGVFQGSEVAVSDLAVRRNTIRMTLNALLLFVFFLVGFLALRSRKRTEASGCSLENRVS